MSSLISVGITHINKCHVDSSIIYKTITRFLHIKIWKTLSPVGTDLTGRHLMKRELGTRRKQREYKQERKKSKYCLEGSKILSWKDSTKNLSDLTHILSQSQERKSTDRSQPPFQSSEINCWKEAREKDLDSEDSLKRGLMGVAVKAQKEGAEDNRRWERRLRSRTDRSNDVEVCWPVCVNLIGNERTSLKKISPWSSYRVFS